MTTATIAATSKTQLQPPVGPSVDSLCHSCLTARFPIFETSATALCGTTGKNATCSDHFWSFRCGFAWQAQKRQGFVKNDGRRGTFEEDLQDTFSGGCILEHQIFSCGKMILRDRCSTPYDLASLFRGRRCFRQVEWKNRKTHWYEAVSSALNFPFLKESRTIVSLVMLSTSKIEEVSHNSFVFDVVKFKNWGSLAQFLRFDVVKFKIWRGLAELLRFQTCR